MNDSIATIVSQLEASSNPATAFFSYATDDAGENGVIKANAEGLRLYAAELLKKSLQMEQALPLPCKTLCFHPQEWMVSEAGYDLITGVMPQYETRQAILTASTAPQQTAAPGEPGNSKGAKSGCMTSLLMLTGLFALLVAALHWF